MALKIRQLTLPDGKQLIYFQEDGQKTNIIVSRETIEWALKELAPRSRRARRRLMRPHNDFR